MNVSQCEQLDAYLDGWLSDVEASDFEAHLADCPACGRQLDQQRRIDHLLARGAGQLERMPHGLVDRIELQIRLVGRRRLVRLAGGLSAAAVLLIGLWFVAEHFITPEGSHFVSEGPDDPIVVQRETEPPTQATSNVESLVRIRPSDPSAAILVSETTENPNVTIVWFHPTVKPVRRFGGTDTD